MKLFGRRAGRAPEDSGARPALSLSASGVIGQWPPSYETQVREGYGRNPVAQRAVRLVAEAVGGAPLIASDPALAALVQARSGGQALLETVATQLLLHGNAFVQLLRGADDGVAALYALRPERVTAECDASGWPVAYLYRVGSRVTRLAADGPRPDVVHLKALNPLDDHYGMGCLPAAAAAIAGHNAAAAWNKALLDNAARPSGALVYEPGDGSTLSPEQFARLRAEMEQGFAGAAQAGRPMLLEGGLRWQALSLTPADMDFIELKAAAAREIALAFGVPPMLLGLPGDSTHANYREAADTVPLLRDHRGAPVGEVSVREDVRGLLVEGFADGVRVGDGLSVGYRATRVRQGARREILAVRLVEVSLVAIPTQPGARVFAVE